MSAAEQAQFLEGLAADLNSKNIALPSFPDIVINIRTALEDPTCTAERLAELAKADPVLVSRLLMSANSAFNNRAGIEIVDLGLAISRLGFEAVRNAAITLAVEQLFNAEQHDQLRERLKDLWTRSIDLASMSMVVGQSMSSVNADNAYLCGLLHEVGKLYILSKAGQYPAFLGDDESVQTVLADWHGSVGRSILGAWGFPDDIVASMDADEIAANDADLGPAYANAVAAAMTLLDSREVPTEEAPAELDERYGISAEKRERLLEQYQLHVQSLREFARR